MDKNLIYSIIYLTATTMMGRAEVEKRHGAASIKTQERICKDCYFYTGGTCEALRKQADACKQVWIFQNQN